AERCLEFAREQFKRYVMRPGTICFELTETAAIANFDKAARFFGELKSLGCLFSLDDFGAGMSSFGYLKHLSVDFLKIDGSFVKDVAHDSVDLAMARAINDVGQVMGKKTIGEAVDGEMGLAARRAALPERVRARGTGAAGAWAVDGRGVRPGAAADAGAGGARDSGLAPRAVACRLAVPR